MGLFDRLKDAAGAASSMVAKATELQAEVSAQNAGKEAVPDIVNGAMLGMFDQCGYLLIHDADVVVDAMYFPDPTGIGIDQVLDYLGDELVFDDRDDRIESGEFWNVGVVEYAFDNAPGVSQGTITAFIPNVRTCHAFYCLLFIDDDGDLRFSVFRQHNPAAAITPADCPHYDTLRRIADGFMKSEELFGWTYGAAKRLMDPAYYRRDEVVSDGMQPERAIRDASMSLGAAGFEQGESKDSSSSVSQQDDKLKFRALIRALLNSHPAFDSLERTVGVKALGEVEGEVIASGKFYVLSRSYGTPKGDRIDVTAYFDNDNGDPVRIDAARAHYVRYREGVTRHQLLMLFNEWNNKGAVIWSVLPTKIADDAIVIRIPLPIALYNRMGETDLLNAQGWVLGYGVAAIVDAIDQEHLTRLNELVEFVS